MSNRRLEIGLGSLIAVVMGTSGVMIGRSMTTTPTAPLQAKAPHVTPATPTPTTPAPVALAPITDTPRAPTQVVRNIPAPRAENGSYYGETSRKTGAPKTVHVNGYTRKDGTHVQGHYRSAPHSGGGRGGRR